MFNPNIPIGTISPQTQAPEVQNNFSQFGTVFAENHTAFNDTDQGEHETILMTIQTVDPAVTLDNQVIYAKNAPSKAGTQPQLWARIPKFLPIPGIGANPGNPPMQLTYNEVNTIGPVYQSFLVGGYLLYFGQVSDITVPVTLSPAPTQILSVIANPATTFAGPGTFTVSTSVLSNSQFMIFSSLGRTPYTFTWMAIAQS